MIESNDKGTKPERITSLLPSLEPPLKEAWKIDLSSKSFIWALPRIRGDSVSVRCGNLVSCIDIYKGKLLWEAKVDDKDQLNEIFLSTPDILITASNADGESTLIALDWNHGVELWKEQLSGSVMKFGLAADGTQLYVINAEEDNSIYNVKLFDIQNGDHKKTFAVSPGANYALIWNGRLYYGSRSFWENEQGLYLMDLSTGRSFKLLDTAVGIIKGDKKAIISVIKDEKSKRYRIIALSPDSKILWSADSFEFMADVDANQVAYIEPAFGKGARAVLCDELKGNFLWKSEFLEYESLNIFLSADSVCIQDEEGITFLNRIDGRKIARLVSPEWGYSWGGAMAPGRLILGHKNQVICYTSIKNLY